MIRPPGLGRASLTMGKPSSGRNPQDQAVGRRRRQGKTAHRMGECDGVGAVHREVRFPAGVYPARVAGAGRTGSPRLSQPFLPDYGRVLVAWVHQLGSILRPFAGFMSFLIRNLAENFGSSAQSNSQRSSERRVKIRSNLQMNRSALALVASLSCFRRMSLHSQAQTRASPTPARLVPTRCLDRWNDTGTNSSPCAGFSRRQVRFQGAEGRAHLCSESFSTPRTGSRPDTEDFRSNLGPTSARATILRVTFSRPRRRRQVRAGGRRRGAKSDSTAGRRGAG